MTSRAGSEHREGGGLQETRGGGGEGGRIVVGVDGGVQEGAELELAFVEGEFEG